MRVGTLLVLLLGLIVVGGAGIAGWDALRTRSGAPERIYGVGALVIAPPPQQQNGPLQAMITVTWNVATRQAKCYVGQSFCGVVGQGGEVAGAKKLREVAQSAANAKLIVNVVVDADTKLPYGHLLHVVNVMTRATGAVPTFRSPPQPIGPPAARNAPSPGLPEVELARPVTYNGPTWLLRLDGVTGTWKLGFAGDPLSTVRLDEVAPRVQQVRQTLGPGQADAALIWLPKDANWGIALAAVQRLRAAGLQQCVFLTSAPKAPPAAPAPAAAPAAAPAPAPTGR